MKRRMLYLWLAPLLVLLCLSLAPGLRGTETPFSSKNFSRLSSRCLILTIDTLRADHVGAYNAEVDYTPAMDKLARSSVVFDRAYTPVPLTLPAHASLLTGLDPPHHRVRDNGPFRLATEVVTLAEIAQQNGFRTAAFVSAFPVDSRFGLDQGFELYDDRYISQESIATFVFSERPANETMELAIQWIKNNTDTHWFLWIHLFDPHLPYTPPPRLVQKYGNLYNSEIAFADEQIGKLHHLLESLGLLEETLFIITADHGEGLGEHGEETHGTFVYNTTVHIPLFIHQPAVLKPRRSQEAVSLIDIMPTIIDWFGWKGSALQDGLSFKDHLLRGSTLPSRPLYLETLTNTYTRRWAPVRGIIEENIKLVDLPLPELYNLKTDFQEKNNLARTSPKLWERYFNSYHNLLDRLSAGGREKTSLTPLSPEERAKLRSLGYLSATTPPTEELSTYAVPEKDPKNLLKVAEAFDKGMIAVMEGRLLEGIRWFEKAISLQPDFSAAYMQLALAYDTAGDTAKGVQVLEKAVEMKIDTPDIRSNLGQYLQKIGELDRSIKTLENALKFFPDDIDSLNFLGISYFHRGDIDRAMDIFNRILQLDPTNASLHNNMGNCWYAKKDYDKAETSYQMALRYDGKMSRAYNGLAIIRAIRNDLPVAVENFQKALYYDPQNIDAALNLAKIYITMQKWQEALKLYQEVLKQKDLLNPQDVELIEKRINQLKKRIGGK